MSRKFHLRQMPAAVGVILAAVLAAACGSSSSSSRNSARNESSQTDLPARLLLFVPYEMRVPMNGAPSRYFSNSSSFAPFMMATSSESSCASLEATGSNLYLETAASGPANVGTPGQDGLGTIRQGYLEESTVDSVREVTELIKAQRGYELNAKVITAADQMLSATTEIR